MYRANVNSFNSFAINERWRVLSGSVRLCPPLSHRRTLEAAKAPPRSGVAAGSPPRRLRRGGRRERRQTPSARAQRPAKPGSTSPAWGSRGEGCSAPTASSRCRVASPFAVAAPGWAKFGLLRRRAWRQTAWLRGLGAICSPRITPGSPGVAFKMTFFIVSVGRGEYRCPWACL